MSIDIYSKYKVKIHKVFNTLSEENETIYDNIFVSDNLEKIIELHGYELLNVISENLKDYYISEFVIVGNELHFEYFNYNNGESKSECYTILGYVN